MIISRNQRQAQIDTWLRDHRLDLEKQDPTAVALQMRRAGLYSPKTSLTDIRCALRRRSSQLGLLTPPIEPHEFAPATTKP